MSLAFCFKHRHIIDIDKHYVLWDLEKSAEYNLDALEEVAPFSLSLSGCVVHKISHYVMDTIRFEIKLLFEDEIDSIVNNICCRSMHNKNNFDRIIDLLYKIKCMMGYLR